LIAENVNIKRSAWFGILLAIGLAISLLVFPVRTTAQTAALPSTPTELRGVWLTNIDSDVLFSRRSVRRAIRRLSSLNFNTVYPTVWNWGYTLYPSLIAEQAIGRAIDPTPGLAGRDMLAEIVTQGHQQGMTVIPWFEFGLMAPADSDLANRHSDWLTQRRDGSKVVMEGTHPRVWLNPLHPEVQQLMVNLMSEIAGNYDVDGIQLDDHFGMPVELGYDPYTVQIYQRENQGRRPPDDPLDPAWMRWRADKITGLMTQVFHAVKARKPDCLMALSPNPQPFSYQAFLQDWATWERQGLVEELIVQVYRDSLTAFTAELTRPEVLLAQSHIPVGVGVLTGLKNRPIAMSQIQNQVQTVRDRHLAGVSFFFYETLGDRDGAFRTLFPRPAARPQIGNA
jgi:uncharacterized lipoprotein YddW (UPF0748 family)